MMLTIDCRDVESIKNELAVYVSDQVGAIPALKLHEFMLSPIEDDGTVDKSVAISAIKEYLESIGEERNFAVISSNDVIVIKSLYGKSIERDSMGSESMFSCSHCGFVTRFEGEYQTHMRIHYL